MNIINQVVDFDIYLVRCILKLHSNFLCCLKGGDIQMRFLAFPFILMGRLVELTLKATGRFMAVLIGIIFLMLGITLTITIIGAIIGIPLAITGFMLILRGFF